MGKKWYNFFVTVQPPGEGGGEGDPSGSDASPARTVADIAAHLGEPPSFSKTLRDPTSFEEVYSAAEIQAPTHGYTIFKIAEMLQSEHIRNLPAGVKKSSVLVALDASGVKLEEVIQDAIRRDRALDTYERVQQKALDELEAKKKEENQGIQEALDRIVAEHRARIQANIDEVARTKGRFQDWRLRKLQEEQRIADAVSYFVTENPITTSSSSPSPGSPSKAKEQG